MIMTVMTVMAVAEGVTHIVAVYGGVTASASVRVTPRQVGSVTISPLSSTVLPEGTVTLKAAVRDVQGRPMPQEPVTWSTSNNAVARVSTDGVVTGVAAGIAVITAKDDDERATASITVLQRPVESVVVLLPADPRPPDAAPARIHRTHTEAEGRFTIARVRPGRYVAAALDALEWGRESDPTLQQRVRFVGRMLIVEEGQTATVDLDLMAGP